MGTSEDLKSCLLNGSDMMTTEIGTPSEETLALEKYISEKKDGEFVTYKELKDECDVDVRTNSGRGKFYTACKRLGRECLNVQNYGYKLSSPSNALTIADNKVGRIKGAAKRAIVATSNLSECHSKDMTDSQNAALQSIELGSKAIIGKVQSARKIIRKEHPVLSEVNPTI